MTSATFDEAGGRPLWLVTLADLSLLLLGFFVLMQAMRAGDRPAVADGIRQAFGADAAATTPAPEQAMPVDQAMVGGFASDSANMPPLDGIDAWVREAARDPRTVLTLTGTTLPDGDADPATGSRDVLATDRAVSVARALIERQAITPDRLRIAAPGTAPRPRVMLAIGYAGHPLSNGASR